MRSITGGTILGSGVLFAEGLERRIEGNEAYIAIGLVFALLVFAVLFFVRSSEAKRLRTQLKEKEEKVEWLRRIKGENEYRLNQRIQELEKQTTELQHTIEDLERRLREGTKNQVVAKLEALQRKREQAMREAGMEA
jgi:uncharacterized membrane protein YgaE (UPF0421/DUF939 family)